jgi:hypothetical protein
MSKLNELMEWHNKVVEGGYFPPSNLIMDKARSLLAEEAAQKPTNTAEKPMALTKDNLVGLIRKFMTDKALNGYDKSEILAERILSMSGKATAPASLVDELREWWMIKPKSFIEGQKKANKFLSILDRYTPTDSIAEEPLAVLAQRKDRIIWIEGPYKPAVKKGWTIHILNHEQHHHSIEIAWGRTYAASEAKARQYLESLSDHKEEKKK